MVSTLFPSVRTLAVLLALACVTVQAQTITAVDISGLQGTYLLTVQGGSVTVSPITLVRPGVIPGPGPIPIPVPIGDLAATVKAATAAVPNYADKDTHRRAMAFGFVQVAQASAGSPTPIAAEKSRATAREFANAVCGPDAAKWNPWWAAVDAKLNTLALTPATCPAALNEMATAITADLPPGAEESPEQLFGTRTFGLSPEFLKFLMEVLLPMLIKLLLGL